MLDRLAELVPADIAIGVGDAVPPMMVIVLPAVLMVMFAPATRLEVAGTEKLYF